MHNLRSQKELLKRTAKLEKELAVKRRVLEIEAALEKVRTVAVGMHQPGDLLDVCKVLFKQLLSIGFVEIRNAMINIHNDADKSFINYDYSDQLGKSTNHLTYSIHPLIEKQIKKIRSTSDAFSETYFTGKDLTQWKKFRKRIGEKDDPRLRNAKGLYYYLYSIGTGSIGISTFGAISHEKKAVLKRFSSVFQLSYQRYVDITNAEAQAREAKIEAALEKVRSRSLAMHQSSELKEVVADLFQKLQELEFGVDKGAAVVVTYSPGSSDHTQWIADAGQAYPVPFYVAYTDHLIPKDLWNARVSGLDFFSRLYTRGEKNNYFRYLFKNTDYRQVPEHVRQMILQSKSYGVSIAFEKNSAILVPSTSGRLVSEDEKIILKRFAKVFEQSYVRFLDLEKAEAQAREARIEAALERVRARSMAMHHSSEAHDVAKVLFHQLRSFGGNIMNAGITLCKHDADEDEYWLSSDAGPRPVISIPHTEDPIQKKLYEGWKNKSEFFSASMGGPELRAHYEYMSSVPTLKPFFQETGDWSIPTWQKWHAAYFSHGYLFMITLEPYAEERILIRFAKVFEQAYTRFLDLQKAEAQAREAQIESSLERVRASAMAMQSSEELNALIGTVFTELTKLDLVLTRCVIWVFEPATNGARWWMANGEQPSDPMSFYIKYHEHPSYLTFVNGWKNQNVKFVYDLKGQDKIDWDNILFNETELKNLPDVVKNGMRAPARVLLSASFNNFGGINAASLEPLSDEQFDILLRFAKVFDLTHTRFLDLKNAEAQARESQIQLALERVRASTMAMHRSEDLAETAQIVFHQLQELGEMPDRMSIGIVDEANSLVDFWSTDQLGSHINNSFKARLDERTVISKTYQAWKENKRSLVIELHGEELKEWIRFARDEMNIPVKDDFIKDRRVHNLGFFSHGWLLVTTHELQSTETIQILERFASVFNLTYRRFLDLKKAEAQAKEAQVEAALERVRSRSMAMHQSSDLHEVIKVVTEQLCGLGIKFNVSNFAKIDSEGSWDLWLSTPEQAYPSLVHVPYIDHGLFNNLIEVIKHGGDFLVDVYDEHETKIFFKHFFENTIARTATPEARKQIVMKSTGFARSVFLTKNIWLAISNYNGIPFSNEENAIFKRFANAFEQTYTRFLDLQKAEANAREAQIEASLERVRSKTMAMHNSNDVGETVAAMFAEFVHLNIHTHRCGILIFDDDHTAEVWTARSTPGGNAKLIVGELNLDAHVMLRSVYNAWKAKQTFYQYDLLDEDLLRYYTAINNSKFYPTQFDLDALPSKEFHSDFFFTDGAVFSFTNEPVSEEHSRIMKRFAGVFGQTYRRYLDLQRAEAQAREAQIEAALERVRSRSMAMHHSGDLQEVIKVVAEQFIALGLRFDTTNFADVLPDGSWNVWISTPIQAYPAQIFVPHFKHRIFTEEDEMISSGKDFLARQYTVEEKNSFFRHFFENTVARSIPQARKEYVYGAKGFIRSSFRLKNIWFAIATYDGIPYSVEENAVFRRFATVFEQAYTRFLDLQKAEAQAKEAQIEASLERVRAKAMAMHSSQDLVETIQVFYRELKSSSVTPRRCGVALMDKKTKLAELTTMNTTEEGDSIEVMGQIKMYGHPVLDCVFENWLIQKEYHAVLRGNEIKEYYKVLRPQISIPDYPHDMVQYGYYFMFNEGDVYAWTDSELPEEHLKIYRRFASVISLTYKRYLDLKQAEAQAREAQIEAGLERVRARTMAMHTSDDVSAATATMFTELEKLGIENFRGGITNMFSNRTQHVWSVNNLAEARPVMNSETGELETVGQGKVVRAVGTFNMDDHPFWQKMYKEWEEKNDFTHYFLAGQEKEDYIKILNTTQGYLTRAIENFPDVHFHVYFFNEGGVWTNSLHAHTDEEQQIMKRFTAVFSLTFRRYQDLRKAEAQAREATIEAALEKVRGKAMAMHNSNDLSVTASMVFTELRKLGINPIRCGVGLLNKESRKAQLYSATSSGDGDSLALVGWVILSDHPVLEKIYETWLDSEEYYPELQGEQMRSYYELLLKGLPVAVQEVEANKKQYGHFLPFSVGCLYAWSETRYSESAIKILKRFATIIDLTFRRYMELQQSEANAKEAVKQAALDRIRADIASMRTVADLDRITPLIWNELTILGLQFIRCGIFLMDDTQRLIHTFLSTPEGKAIAAFHMPYDTQSNFDEAVNNWHLKRIYVTHWTEPDFFINADIMVKHGAITDREQYLRTLPPGGFYLHFLPFLQGMLYVGSLEKLGDDEINLVGSVADAFSTAYARYEDFNRLEAAKKQVEKTLVDLKQAQTQLVQSEKMASLGELTAGIAHEIQNPLNFVNNFSDVSNELLEEMKEELAKGNINDAMAIAEDVKQNLEKINHHGKRAEGIVKGMLQHSRTSSSQKEMTDINALADEYLRLAFHGLRAKDKSFNAKFETNFDDGVGKINIVPQDIGRVLLNLINNAFYAVNEKQKYAPTMAVLNGYEPTVGITTTKQNANIEITVKDNGNGVPQDIVDKIFQPFFTTKPTGQGTGLGLSLSYDIVKAHGGEIKVKTKKGVGTEFIVVLSA